MTKTPNPIDVHVGGRVRHRRMVLGISQTTLGERIGLTFQQIQKYEKGSNRISASRLFELSQILDAPVQFFFEEAPLEFAEYVAPDIAEPEEAISDFLNSLEGLELNRAFMKIRDAKVRRKLIEFVRTLARKPQ